MSIAVIGGGATGLATAYELTKRGYAATVFERAPVMGGLAGSIKVLGADIEKYYHFICATDRPYLQLLPEIGLADALAWGETSMGYYYGGKIYNFGRPADLLRFTPLSLPNRLRFGLNILYARFLKDWKKLESISARDWLIKHVGEEAFFVIWEPLLRIKFGQRADDISAAWIWSRAQRVAASRKKGMQQEVLGYLRGGTQRLVDTLTQRIVAAGGTLRPEAAIEQILIEDGQAVGVQVDGRPERFEAVVSTVALPLFLRLAPDLPTAYRAALEQIDYIGVVCILMVLNRPLTRHFWLNINDPDIPYAGIIEYTNLNPVAELPGRHLAYIPFYTATTEPRYRMSKEALYAELLEKLPKIFPDFNAGWIEEFLVHRDAYAQPVCTIRHSEKIPQFRSPVRRLYITDASQIYPEDRGISNCIGLGRDVASALIEDGVAVPLERVAAHH